MSLKRLQKIKRFVAQYPKVAMRESAKDREFEQYYRSLSNDELDALYNEKMAELDNDPKWIAERERLSKMTIEQLTTEYFIKLKAC